MIYVKIGNKTKTYWWSDKLYKDGKLIENYLQKFAYMQLYTSCGFNLTRMQGNLVFEIESLTSSD